MVKICNYRFKIYPNNTLIPIEVCKYDEKIILEALHNCIAHQRYQSNCRIIVTEKEECLEFWNAGDFFEGKYEDYIKGIKTPKKYRNPFLVQAMVNIKIIDYLFKNGVILDLSSYPFDNIEGNGQGDIKNYNIADLANMFYDAHDTLLTLNL